MEHAVGSDKGIGLGIAFSLLAVVGTVAMLGGPDQIVRAWGFAGTMVSGLLAIVAIHVYGA